MQEMINKPSSVAIIGAGIAGLTCASKLQAQGFSVTVFEKSRGVGGRMSTRTTPSWQCDHGAQYFTARSPAFEEEVARWQGAGVAELWSPRLRIIEGERNDLSAAAARTKRYVGVPRMSAPAHFLAESLAVQLHMQVDGLKREPSGWRLRIQDKGWQDYLFDALVLALPAPQALVLLDPIACKLKDLIKTVHMRPAWALMMQFDECFAPDFDAMFVNSGPIRWIARDRSKPQRQGDNMWLLHATPQWSELHLEAEQTQVTELLLGAFRAVCSTAPLACTLHRWRYADTQTAIGQDRLWDAQIALGLCGDWLSEAKVEGAWRSGLSLAQAMTDGSALTQQFAVFEFGSARYASTLKLRNEILRNPLGRVLDAADLEGEQTQLHYGVLSASEELLACLSARKIDQTHYKIRQMAVSKKCQGQGVGSRLVAHVEEELAKKGIQEISLHARESAIGFYEKLGYKRVGALFDEVGIAHIKMIKRIA